MIKAPKTHWEILSSVQKAILSHLVFLRECGMYLAGGTALALQLGHRESLDYDFFTTQDFNDLEIFERLKKFDPKLTIIQQARNTLYVNMRGITVSMFKYIYPLVQPAVRLEHVDLASLQDIGAMKIQAIIDRGTRRDFIDFWVLLNELTLDQMLVAHQNKYGQAHNTYLALQALMYFSDAEEETSMAQRKILVPLEWKKVKSDILKHVFEFRQKKI